MKPLATLGDLMNWRAELRSNGVPTRPPPSLTADRGHVEQPGERREPPPRRVVIPIEALEREQLEALAEELGEPSPYEEKKPPALVATKPSAFAKPAPAPVAENDSEEEAEPVETIVKGHKYSLEFKARAVARVLAGERARAVAADMGTLEQNVSIWIKKAQREAGAAITGRRVHPDSVKARAVQRVLDGGEAQAAVADSLNLVPSVVSRWVTQERERREKMSKPDRRTTTFVPPKIKMEAVRRVRELQAQHGPQRGQIARVARDMGDRGVQRETLSSWCNSGEWEPDPKPNGTDNKTMMSRPEPQPMSQPASTTQPMVAQPLQYHPAPPMPYPPQPLAPPPWWNAQQAAPPPSAPAPSSPMLGLEEYIKRMVAHEMELQLPAAVQAALTKMWGPR